MIVGAIWLFLSDPCRAVSVRVQVHKGLQALKQYLLSGLDE